MVKIGTRGFIGTKSKGIIKGYYNHWDSYYSNLGKKAIETYFAGDSITELAPNDEKEQDSKDGDIFLYDGLFCEYGYVQNLDNDTLEVYRGFFKEPQIFTQYESGHDGAKYFIHLIFVIDKKIHTEEQAYKTMDAYDKSEKEERDIKYPERKTINICNTCFKNIDIKKRFCSKQCEDTAIAEAL